MLADPVVGFHKAWYMKIFLRKNVSNFGGKEFKTAVSKTLRFFHKFLLNEMASTKTKKGTQLEAK